MPPLCPNIGVGIEEKFHVCLREHFCPDIAAFSNHRTSCPWKGQAHYKSLLVDGELNPDAVWYYPEPNEAAKEIKGRVAFWKGVKVE